MEIGAKDKKEIVNFHTKLINFGGQICELNNGKCLYLPKHNTLVLSDIHLGKSAHFRKNGLQVSNIVHQHDIHRLDSLLNYYKPQRVLIVGDLVHATYNDEWKDFQQLVLSYASAEFILIKGNHDSSSEKITNKLGLRHVVQEYNIENINFTHIPHFDISADKYQISGHLHPGISVKMPFKKTMKFPCFAITGNQLTLPAFSEFTGLDTSSITKLSTYHAFHEQGFFELQR